MPLFFKSKCYQIWSLIYLTIFDKISSGIILNMYFPRAPGLPAFNLPVNIYTKVTPNAHISAASSEYFCLKYTLTFLGTF